MSEKFPKPNAPQQALACYGAVEDLTGTMHLYFCHHRPKSDTTLLYLPQFLQVARQQHKKLLILFWDHASWHKSKKVRCWLSAYNQQAKRTGDVRLLVWLLPKHSPWLNPIEPRWLHAKRAVMELSAQELTPEELRRRLAAYFGVPITFLDPTDVP